jgi:hypothetical protein
MNTLRPSSLRITVALMISAGLAAVGVTTPSAAKAEPHTYSMTCFAFGQQRPVTELLQCRAGTVGVFSTYDGSRVATVDVEGLVHGLTPRSLSKTWRDCQRNWVCSTAAGAAAEYVFKRVKKVWEVWRTFTR